MSTETTEVSTATRHLIVTDDMERKSRTRNDLKGVFWRIIKYRSMESKIILQANVSDANGHEQLIIVYH